MKIFDRIILTVYMLILVLVSVCIVLFPFNIIPLSVVDMIIGELYSKWYYTLIGLLFLVISIRLLISGISTDRRNRGGVVKPAEYGDITVSTGTFESLAMRVVKQVPGIKDVKVKVAINDDGLSISTKLLVLPDVNIPQTVGEVQGKIKNYIESITEVGVREVKVDIEDIAQVNVPRVS